MSNKLVTQKNKEMDLINKNINALNKMVNSAVAHQLGVAPKLQEIANKTLEILSKDDELANLEPKDIIKLTEMASKAILQPVEQLTKLVQAVSSLYEKSVLEDRMKKVEKLIDRIDHESKDSAREIDMGFDTKEDEEVKLDDLL